MSNKRPVLSCHSVSCVRACLRDACARLFVLYYLLHDILVKLYFTLCSMVHPKTQNEVVVNKYDRLLFRLDFVQFMAAGIPVTSPSITSKLTRVLNQFSLSGREQYEEH